MRTNAGVGGGGDNGRRGWRGGEEARGGEGKRGEEESGVGCGGDNKLL